jgi:hypothetical protein
MPCFVHRTSRREVPATMRSYTYAELDLRFQSAQLAQLRQLNQHLWQQQHEEQRQRHLSDVLLAAAQGAERVHRTLAVDPFAAGVLALQWLQATGWIHSGLFSDFARKERWEHSRGIFQMARDGLYRDGSAAALAELYLRVSDREGFLHETFRGDPEPTMRRLHHDSATARDKHRRALRTLGIALGATTLVLGVGFLASVALAEDGSGLPGFVLVGIAAFSLIGGIGYWFVDQAAKASKALAARLAYLQPLAHEWGALANDERGFAMLDRVRRGHPFLLTVPDAPPPSSSTVLERQTVERQTVVGRCRYCGNLTPVDLKRCKLCGADNPF